MNIRDMSLHEADVLREDVVGMIHRTNTLVEGIEQTWSRMEEYSQSLDNIEVTAKLEAGLGVVVVDGRGKLIRVEFDASALRTADYRSLGRRLVNSISEAEDLVANIHAKRFDEISKQMF